MDKLAAQKKVVLGEIANILAQYPQVPTSRFDVFTPGVYTRSLRMPKDSLFVTETHKSVHQYILAYGTLEVWSTTNGWEKLSAPKLGVTVPGTQRLFRTHSEVLWITIHPTDICPKDDTKEAHQKAVDEITELIIDKNYDPYKEELEVEL